MNEKENQSVQIARLEERMAGTAKALELAQGSIAQAASLDKRVSVLEAQQNSSTGERKGKASVWDKIIVALTLVVAALALFFKH